MPSVVNLRKKNPQTSKPSKLSLNAQDVTGFLKPKYQTVNIQNTHTKNKKPILPLATLLKSLESVETQNATNTSPSTGAKAGSPAKSKNSVFLTV